MQPILEGCFAKLSSAMLEAVLEKVRNSATETIGTATAGKETAHFVFYQEATQYWVKATAELPYYEKNGAIGPPAHGRYLYFSSAQKANAACAILNSSLFYVYFIAYGDCFHLSGSLASTFPVAPTTLTDNALANANQLLMKELKLNAERKTIVTTNNDRISYDEYRVSKSKMFLDRIDFILATHFGFSPMELDAVLNYDIKYRMGGEEGDED
jgi:hypothetical protein